ncbi:MAG: hypothetical protein ABI142_04090, partial [Bryocella sp.]
GAAIAAVQNGDLAAPNTAAVMVALVGQCSNVANAPHITINEATTVATVYTMNQFMNFTLVGSAYYPQIGAPADAVTTTYSPTYSNYTTGLNNAFLTYSNLVNANGQLQTTFTPSGSILGMTATPEVGKEALVANMLSACVQQATYVSSQTTDGCGTLFNNTSAPGQQMVHLANQASVMKTSLAGNGSADTLLATWYLVTNPNQGAANIAAQIGGTSKGTSPFPGADATEGDWTLGIAYSAGSNMCGASGNSQAPFSAPLFTAVDKSGSVWVLNGPPTAIGTAVQLSSTGALMTCVDGTGGLNIASGAAIGTSSSPMLIDVAGNVWYALPGTTENTVTVNAGYELAEYTAAGTFIQWPLPAIKTNVNYNPFTVATDHGGNVFFAGYYVDDYPQYQFTASQIAAGITQSAANLQTSTLFANISARIWGSIVAYNGGNPYMFATGATTGYDFAITGTPPYTFPTASGTTFSAVAKQGFPGVDNGNVAGASVSATAVPGSTWFQANPTSNTALTVSAQFLGGLSSAGGFAVDGVSHYWAALQSPSTGTTYGVASAYNAGSIGTPTWTALSPAATASTCTATNVRTCSPGGSFQHTAITGAGLGTSIDPSGNVWMGMASGTAATSGVFELVGAAAPVVTTLSQH